MGGPRCVTSSLSLSLSHNTSAVALSPPGQTQEPVAPEKPAARQQPAAPEEPAVPEEPAPSRRLGRLKIKILPPKPQNQPVDDEDAAMTVDDSETAKVSTMFFPPLHFLTVLEGLSALPEAKGCRRSFPSRILQALRSGLTTTGPSCARLGCQ